MDPWQPISSKSSDDDVTATTPVTLTTIFPQFPERKTMDSTQYLSIIGITFTGCHLDLEFRSLNIDHRACCIS